MTNGDVADAFGRMVADYHRCELADQPVYERSDGHEQPAHCAWYFSEPSAWPAVDREALARASGAVLDLGCGPGRAGLSLQECGHRVVGVDASPCAVAVARERGLDEAVVSEMAALPLGTNAVDSAVAFGSHVGAGGVEAFRALLEDLDRVLHSGGRILADCYDPTRVTEPSLHSYLEARAIDDGLATRRFRLRYDGTAGPWRTLLCSSPDALDGLLEPTRWQVETVLRSDGPRYWFVLCRP